MTDCHPPVDRGVSKQGWGPQRYGGLTPTLPPRCSLILCPLLRRRHCLCSHPSTSAQPAANLRPPPLPPEGGKGRSKGRGRATGPRHGRRNRLRQVPTHAPLQVQKWLSRNDITISGGGFRNPILTFDETPFPRWIDTEIHKAFSGSPTLIQSVAWPLALSGFDVIGIAETGPVTPGPGPSVRIQMLFFLRRDGDHGQRLGVNRQRSRSNQRRLRGNRRRLEGNRSILFCPCDGGSFSSWTAQPGTLRDPLHPRMCLCISLCGTTCRVCVPRAGARGPFAASNSLSLSGTGSIWFPRAAGVGAAVRIPVHASRLFVHPPYPRTAWGAGLDRFALLTHPPSNCHRKAPTPP